MLFCIEVKKRGLIDKVRYRCSWSDPTLCHNKTDIYFSIHKYVNGIPRKLSEEFELKKQNDIGLHLGNNRFTTKSLKAYKEILYLNFTILQYLSHCRVPHQLKTKKTEKQFHVHAYNN